MAPWAWWLLAFAGGPFVLYGLHRLALWLEARGHLYYSRKRPPGGGGVARGFVAFQEIVDPRSQHVTEVREEKRGEAEEGVPGAGAWPAGRSPWAPRDESSG